MSKVAYSNAPRCTIDVAALKPSRFLLHQSSPPQLPFRDEAGAITLCLLEESIADVRAKLPGSSLGALATEFGVSRSAIQRIKKQQSSA